MDNTMKLMEYLDLNGVDYVVKFIGENEYTELEKVEEDINDDMKNICEQERILKIELARIQFEKAKIKEAIAEKKLKELEKELEEKKLKEPEKELEKDLDEEIEIYLVKFFQEKERDHRKAIEMYLTKLFEEKNKRKTNK